MPLKNNPTAPVVDIELGGQVRKLKIDLNALASFEDATGKDFTEAFASAGKSARTIRALLWAAMLHENPKLQISEVGQWVHPGNLAEIAAAVGKAQVLGIEDPSPENPTASQSTAA